MKKFKKLVLPLSLVGMLSLGSTSVFANQVTNLEKQEKGWKEIRKDFETGERKLTLDKGAQPKDYGHYPTRAGLILVTDQLFPWQGDYDYSWTGHAGIVYSENSTVEAFPKGGVQLYNNDWNTRYSERSVYGATHKKTNGYEDEDAAEWAYNKIGTEYNFWASLSEKGMNDTSKMNCATLVYNAFRLTSGYKINQGATTLTPMDLVQSSDVNITYKNF